MFRNPGTPGGRTSDSDEEVIGRPPPGTRVGQSRPGPVEKGESESTAHHSGKRVGQSLPIEQTDVEPGPDNRNAYDFELNLRDPDY